MCSYGDRLPIKALTNAQDQFVFRDPQNIDRLLMRNLDAENAAVARLEQLYPFPSKALVSELARFKQAEMIWCQEEPQNQGAWYRTRHYFIENMRDNQKLLYAGRPSSAAPAVGYYAKHQEQQKALIAAAFGKVKSAGLSK